MGQGAEAFGKLCQPGLQQRARGSLAHLAVHAELERSITERLSVTGLRRYHRMDELVHQHAKDLQGLIQVCADEQLECAVRRGCRMPQLANALRLPAG
ncbi:hypothetical protein AU375_00265 [Methylobacterium radiotolerans]|nr:hypothetical protein AU375_00265 [Methylobacterium radiotolerans]